MTVNQYLGPDWLEYVVRLAFGVSVVDALGAPGSLQGLELALERVPQPHSVPAGAGEPGNYDVGVDLPTVRSNRTGRFAITYRTPHLSSPVSVRVFDRYRRYVPRRFRIPAPTETQVIAEEKAHATSPWPSVASRVFRPLLFPGAAYGTHAGSTVVRGRVLRADGSPARWARVHATSSVLGLDLGWAHGDDRGEFLLFLASSQATLAAPPSPSINVSVTVAARPASVPVDTPAHSKADPLWDLVIESLPVPGGVDAVSPGRILPPGFTATATATLTCVKGRVLHPAHPFVVS